MIFGLLLAAGASERFAGNKLLANISDSSPIALSSATKLGSVVDSMIAVVNPNDAPLIEQFSAENVPVFPCATSHLGVGHSIACGVAHTSNASGWVIALADMPLIERRTIEAVSQALRDGALIVVPMYDGRRGHPVGFSAELYGDLIQLSGDVGARLLLQKYAGEVMEIPCEDPGIHIDIDTPEDLEKYANEPLFKDD